MVYSHNQLLHSISVKSPELSLADLLVNVKVGKGAIWGIRPKMLEIYNL